MYEYLLTHCSLTRAIRAAAPSPFGERISRAVHSWLWGFDEPNPPHATRAPCDTLIIVGALLPLALPVGFYDGKVFGVAIKAPHSHWETFTCGWNIDIMILQWFPQAYWLVKGGFLAFPSLEGRSSALIYFQTGLTQCVTWNRIGKPTVN